MKDVFMSMDNDVALIESKNSKNFIPKVKLVKEEPTELLYQFADSCCDLSDEEDMNQDKNLEMTILKT